MTYSVNYHWDTLKTCIVGKTYPPEFYSWIEDVQTRKRFEQLAEETEEDFKNLIYILKNKFSVEVLRPEFPADMDQLYIDGKWVQPPTAPRDYFIMIQDKFWVPRVPNASHAWNVCYRQNKEDWWEDFVRPQDFYNTYPEYQSRITSALQNFAVKDQKHLDAKLGFYKHIFKKIEQNAEIVYTDLDFINGCFVTRLGNDLYFATQTYYDNKENILKQVNKLWPNTNNHVVNAGGHGDSVYCPVTPGLIISINDVPTYANTFPDWEVVYLPDSDYAHMRKFERSMKINKGRWFMPGFEKDQNLVHIVDHYFDEWVGEVHETVFDVNILIVDPKNIIVSSYNKKVERACNRYGIDMHVVPFRHKYFWDCGIHCITNDLNRPGNQESIL